MLVVIVLMFLSSFWTEKTCILCMYCDFLDLLCFSCYVLFSSHSYLFNVSVFSSGIVSTFLFSAILHDSVVVPSSCDGIVSFFFGLLVCIYLLTPGRSDFGRSSLVLRIERKSCALCVFVSPYRIIYSSPFVKYFLSPLVCLLVDSDWSTVESQMYSFSQNVGCPYDLRFPLHFEVFFVLFSLFQF